MASALFQVGFHRTLTTSLLRQNATIALARRNPFAPATVRTIVTRFSQNPATSSSKSSFPQVQPSRTFLNLVKSNGRFKLPLQSLRSSSKTFFSSARQSLRYYPPTPRPRTRPFLGFLDRIPHNTIIYGIIGLNALVFAMWYMANQKYKYERDPSALKWMYHNFLSSWNNVHAGRIWTLITSSFSHKDWSHILFNGFTFFFTSPVVLQLLGSRNFIFLYLGGGLASSVISLIYARYVDHHDRPTHGASGAIYAIVTLLACAAPRMTFQLYGIIPVPAWLLVSALFTYDAYNTWSDKRGTTDTVGHIGGMLSGAAFFLLLRR